MAAPILLRKLDGSVQHWKATTLREAGLKEADLEATIATDLRCLDLDLRYGQSFSVRQSSLTSPDGQMLRPDLIAVTDHGDLVVVEVKLLGNVELGRRDVVAQVVDYAAALSRLSEARLLAVLDPAGKHQHISDLLAARLPGIHEPDDVADVLLGRAKQGEIMLVIACDRSHRSLVEWVRAAASQSALGFELRVVELTPHVNASAPGEVLFRATTRAKTEVISRTAIQITHEPGTANVVVNVAVTPGEEIEANVRSDQPAMLRGYPPTLSQAEAAIRLPPGTLKAELLELVKTRPGAPWAEVREQLGWPKTTHGPYLRGNGSGNQDGRIGVDLLSPWKPSIFVGVMVDGRDHGVSPSDPALGADFVTVLSVARKAEPFGPDGDAYLSEPEFAALRARLRESAGGWDFHDHLAVVPKPNRWHPIHLRRPLAKVFEGATTPEARRAAWLAAAQDGVARLLAGGELRQLRDRLLLRYPD